MEPESRIFPPDRGAAPGARVPVPGTFGTPLICRASFPCKLNPPGPQGGRESRETWVPAALLNKKLSCCWFKADVGLGQPLGQASGRSPEGRQIRPGRNMQRQLGLSNQWAG